MQQTPIQVKLLTLNTFLRPPPIKTNEDDYKQQRFMDILQIIDQYDIVCFQELFQAGTFRPERILQYAFTKKFYYWKKSDPPHFGTGPVIDSGLMVISKYPILASAFESYQIGILSDSASDKGYIYCKIKIGEGILHLFVTHLQASYMEPGFQKERQLSVKVRLYQIKLLQKRIHEHLEKNNNQIEDLIMLVGDLNINALEVAFELTKETCLYNQIQQPLNSCKQLFSQFEAFQRIFFQGNLQIIDHLYDQHKCHLVTFGDGDKVLTDITQSSSKQRLDYIFTLRQKDKPSRSLLRAKAPTCKIQKFEQKNKPYSQISDHYGMSINIILDKNESKIQNKVYDFSYQISQNQNEKSMNNKHEFNHYEEDQLLKSQRQVKSSHYKQIKIADEKSTPPFFFYPLQKQ